MHKVVKCNAFIIGAPKSGTTSMAHYLAQHEDIFVTTPKEPHFFIKDDMPHKTTITSLEKYQELFSEAKAKVRMEASVWYLYGEKAIENIHRYNPNAKIIIMLRRPDDMIHSLHSQLVLTHDETLNDLGKAWDKCASRRLGLDIPKTCKDGSMLLYDEVAKYGRQVENVLRFFSKNDVKVIFYEDLEKNVNKVYLEVLQFLMVSENPLQSYDVMNKNSNYRCRTVSVLLRHPPDIIVRIAKYLKGRLSLSFGAARGWLIKANSIENERMPLDPVIRSRIIENYLDDIVLLESILGRELTHWKV